MSVFVHLKLFSRGAHKENWTGRKLVFLLFFWECVLWDSSVYRASFAWSPLLVLSRIPQNLNFTMLWDSVLSHLFSLHSLSEHFLALNAFMVTIPNLCFHPRCLLAVSNSTTNISTWLSNWHLKLTLPKWNTWFPPSYLVFPHLSKWNLLSFYDSGHIS